MHPIQTPVRHFTEQSFAFLDFGQMAAGVEAVFRRQDVRINPSSDLARVLRAAHKLAQYHLTAAPATIDVKLIFDGYCCVRLARSTLFLDGKPGAATLLKKLTDGDVNFWNGERTPAKDTEWELYLGSLLLQTGLPIDFFEPDLVVRLPLRTIGIACKRVHSADRIFKEIGEASAQVRRSGLPGVVALCVDSLIVGRQGPRNSYNFYDAPTERTAVLQLNATLNELLEPHRARIQKRFLSTNRLLGVLICGNVYCRTDEHPNRFVDVGGVISEGQSSALSQIVMHTLSKHLAADPPFSLVCDQARMLVSAVAAPKTG